MTNHHSDSPVRSSSMARRAVRSARFRLKRRIRAARLYARCAAARVFYGRKLFKVGTRRYRYFVHPYNRTWATERIVEVPVVLDFISRQSGDGLEVGNVLRHYTDLGMTVVDKYEQAPDVVNVDVVDYRPDRSYDYITTISTVEHIGYDEEERDPQKVVLAIEHLRSLLRPNGRMLVTAPLGYNPVFDAHVLGGSFSPDVETFLVRPGTLNLWKEVRKDAVRPHYRHGEAGGWAAGFSLWIAEFAR